MTAVQGALQRQLAWLLLIAVIFAALAPSISKVLTRWQGVAWIEICSTNGNKRVAVDLDFKKTSDMPMLADNHCGYCLVQQHSPVVPTLSYHLEVAALSNNRVPIGSGGTTFFKRFIRDAHQTRAPPALS